MKYFTPYQIANIVFEKYDSVIFDLDNTIYDENEFLFDRYWNIALRLSCRNEYLAKKYFDFLRLRFLTEGRTKLFDDFLQQFDLASRYTVGYLLDCLRQPLTSLRPFGYFIPLVRHFGREVYLITNGDPRQQQNKLTALGIFHCFSGVVFANEVIKKPSALAIRPLLARGNIGRCIYIGDSDVDRDFASNCCIPFYRLRFERLESGLADQQTIHFEE